MERKIGEVFTCNGELYQVVKGFSCNGCAFMRKGSCYTVNELLGPCDYTKRTDKTNVIFKEVKNMEIKDNKLTIDIPEGMKIDINNSNLKAGVIKFKKKELTYYDIVNSLDECTTFIALTPRNITKLCAIDQLMNIARFYNKDWKPDWNTNKEYKYCIRYDNKYNEYSVYYSFLNTESIVYFKNKEDAQAVIDNFEFKSILDAIYKD